MVSLWLEARVVYPAGPASPQPRCGQRHPKLRPRSFRNWDFEQFDQTETIMPDVILPCPHEPRVCQRQEYYIVRHLHCLNQELAELRVWRVGYQPVPMSLGAEEIAPVSYLAPFSIAILRQGAQKCTAAAARLQSSSRRHEMLHDGVRQPVRRIDAIVTTKWDQLAIRPSGGAKFDAGFPD